MLQIREPAIDDLYASDLSSHDDHDAQDFSYNTSEDSGSPDDENDVKDEWPAWTPDSVVRKRPREAYGELLSDSERTRIGEVNDWLSRTSPRNALLTIYCSRST